MNETSLANTYRSRWVNAALGALVALLIKDLGLVSALPLRPHPHLFIVLFAGLGMATRSIGIRKVFGRMALALLALWILVVATPTTHWTITPLLRSDPIDSPADAVFVLSSGIQADGDLTAQSMTRLLHGLELIQQGHASRLIVSEFQGPSPRNEDAVRSLAQRLRIPLESVTAIGPVSNTRDEAVLVRELARSLGIQKLTVVSSPTHMLRAGAVIEKVGLSVSASPCMETSFNIEGLNEWSHHGDRLEAFTSIIHEYAGLVFYRMQGWI